MSKNKNFKNGFTLLLVLMVSSIVLLVSFGVYSIIVREIELSSFGSESLRAFYAADSGAECALYWDLKKHALMAQQAPNTIKCADNFVSDYSFGAPGGGYGPTTTSFWFGLDNGSCVKIVVTKKETSPMTTIDSFGYNRACLSSYPRKVERGVKITY